MNLNFDDKTLKDYLSIQYTSHKTQADSHNNDESFKEINFTKETESFLLACKLND